MRYFTQTLGEYRAMLARDKAWAESPERKRIAAELHTKPPPPPTYVYRDRHGTIRTNPVVDFTLHHHLDEVEK